MNNFLNVVDISLFSVIILLVILFSIHAAEKQLSVHKRRFTELIRATILLLILDFVAWELNGRSGRYAVAANYWSNAVYLALNPLPVVAWLRYLDTRTPYTFTAGKRRTFLFLPLVISLGMLIANIPLPFVFTIEEGNLYTRGPGILWIGIISMVPLLYPLLRNRGHYNRAERRMSRILVVFSLLPVVGTVLQLIHFGTSLIYSSTTVGILIAFIFLELQSSRKDYLTGLASRSQIDDQIHVRLKQGRAGGPFGLIMIDLDDFKAINDLYGHLEGDQALIIFSNLMTRTFKRQDSIARYGGDEFLLLIDEATPEIMTRVISRLKENVEEFNRKKVKPYRLEFSAGNVIYEPETHTDYHLLLREADQRMYDQKQNNRSDSDANKIIWL